VDLLSLRCSTFFSVYASHKFSDIRIAAAFQAFDHASDIFGTLVLVKLELRFYLRGPDDHITFRRLNGELASGSQQYYRHRR
jgi:hypothetical protein